ncbi:hypothetical protein DdX_19718 [Ditylenchus destructor]|uniref:Uncharacterized protein n=1 Tax=Ditylenchus destructor TaxID=166010 RepID=A0AAD4MHA6_9BILA|nr:hypothetical protein DdX_19718 [Ditylenchus destructor]
MLYSVMPLSPDNNHVRWTESKLRTKLRILLQQSRWSRIWIKLMESRITTEKQNNKRRFSSAKNQISSKKRLVVPGVFDQLLQFTEESASTIRQVI